MGDTDENTWGELPEKYYLAWEQDILEGLSNMEQMTKEIFVTGRADIMDETVRKYHEWDELLTRYRGYLESRDNYCRVLDNGFHLYTPKDFLKVIKKRDFPAIEHLDYLKVVQIVDEDQYPGFVSENTNHQVKFSKYGFATNIGQIEEYVDSIADYEDKTNTPQNMRLVSNSNVMVVRQMNDGLNGQDQLLRPVNRFHKLRHSQEQIAFDHGFKYVWEIILVES